MQKVQKKTQNNVGMTLVTEVCFKRCITQFRKFHNFSNISSSSSTKKNTCFYEDNQKCLLIFCNRKRDKKEGKSLPTMRPKILHLKLQIGSISYRNDFVKHIHLKQSNDFLNFGKGIKSSIRTHCTDVFDTRSVKSRIKKTVFNKETSAWQFWRVKKEHKTRNTLFLDNDF